MQSKFNILILEDDETHQKQLQKTFKKEFNQGFEIFLSSTVEEFIDELAKRYYLGMSLDHKVPLNAKSKIAKKYDIDVINKLNKYHPLGYKSIYTAFPKWDSAKAFGATINYVSKKGTPADVWAVEFKKTLLGYKRLSNSDNIYNYSLNILFFPFASLVNDIIKDADNPTQYQKIFIFSIEMFYILLFSILEKEHFDYADDVQKQLDFISKNLDDLNIKNTPCSQELAKTLDNDFLEDMQILATLFQEKKFNSLDEESQDLMTLLLLKLNFFAANSFATKVKTRRNYLRQIEVEAEKIENRAFKTKEYITDFYKLPQNGSSTYLIFKDYNGKSYFLDVGDYLEITMAEMGSVKVVSKLSGKEIFPMGE